MDAHLCNHPKVPHTVEWSFMDKSDIPRISDGLFENLEEAQPFAQKIIRQNKDHLSWLKIYRTDNELYSCFVWEAPRTAKVESQKVQLEVDMEPLASAFENVAIGFTRQGNSIKKLQISQIILALTVAVDILTRAFS